MKTSSLFSLAGFLSLSLLSCNPNDPQANGRLDENARRQLEETRAAYEKQAADMEARSSKLAANLAALQQSVRDKESADLNAKLEAMQEENERLQADADEARRRSEEVGDQLAALSNPPAGDSNGVAADADSWTDPAADYTPFYEELAPSGRWLDVEGYGYAWHPNVADRTSWQPYVDGRWAWSDQGWAWDSNESFGWACYHYGRWVRIAHYGWVWVPGREWAPAWVAWRSGDDCVGWAPLPPGRHRRFASIGHDCDAYYHLSPSSYTFIQAQHFGRPTYLNVCLPLSRVTNLFQSTVNVTNIVRGTSPQNNIFIHRGGPDRGWLERRMGGQVPRAEVQVVNHLDRTQLRRSSDRRGPEGITQLIAAPIPTAGGSRPVPVKAERIARPALVDAWAEVPADRRKGLREQVTRQARGPQPVAANAVVDTRLKPQPPAMGGLERSPTAPPSQIPPPLRPPLPEVVPPNAPVPDRVAQRYRDNPRGRRDAPQGGRMDYPRQQNDAATAAMQRRQAEIAQQQQQLQEAARKQAEAAAMQRNQTDAQQLGEAQRRQHEAETARLREAALAQQQMQKQTEEQKRLQDGLREAEFAKAREAAAAQRQQMAQQQQAAANADLQRETQRREREAAALAQAREKMQSAQDEKAHQQQALAAQRQQELANAAAMRAQREAAQRQQEQANAAAMRAQQEAAQRQAAAEAARQADAARQAAAMRQQQQEAAQRAQQEAAQRAAQESARRAAEDAARRASEDAARRQRDNNKDDNPKRSR